MTETATNTSDAPAAEGSAGSDGGWKWLPGILAGIAIVIMGMATMLAAGIVDIQSVLNQPWNMTFILFEVPDDLPTVESYPVHVRLVSRDEPLEGDVTLQLLEQWTHWERFEDRPRLTDPELLIALDLPDATTESLLASGRLPEPGKPEVLAGSLARDNPFYIDDVQFHVVGRLADSVSGFLFAYLLPHGADFEELFICPDNAADGLLVVSGDALLEAGVLPEHPFETAASVTSPAETDLDDNDDDEGEPEAQERDTLILPPYMGGTLRAQPSVVRLTMLGLLLAAFGGAVAHYFLFRMLRDRGYRPIQAILDEIALRPGLFIGMHIFLYGLFFLAMYTSINNPLVTYRITQYIEAVFSEGGLGYIGAAYASGDVTMAAWTTFYNNYIEQTLGLTFLISLIPVPLGLVKNMLSFLLVGGAMAPLWVGAAQAYVLHCITMVLELQGYIVACFAITVWPLHLFRGAWTGRLAAATKSGLIMLGSAAILTAAMLGIAAVYEAFTLIRLL